MSTLTHAYSNRLIAEGWELTEPTHQLEHQVVDIETDDGPLKLGVGVVDARDATANGPEGPTFLFSFGYYDNSAEPVATQTPHAVAEELGARIIMVDNIGFGEASAPLDHHFYRRLLLGDFGPTARVALQAIAKTGLLHDGDEVGLMGNSMGNQTISAMAEILQNPDNLPGVPRLRINGTYIIEPTSARNLWQLHLDISRDNKDGLPYYQNLNRATPWLAEPPELRNPQADKVLKRKQLLASGAYAIAISRAPHPASRLAKAIRQDRQDGATGISEGEHTIIFGGQSRIAPKAVTTRALHEIQRELHEIGYAVTQELPGENHHFWVATLIGTAAIRGIR